MLTLAINTAHTEESVALIDGEKLLAEHVWTGQRDESEKLLPAILRVLKKSKKSFEDIRRIIVVRGPGPFSSLRIGVTVANILAMCLNIEIYSIGTKTLESKDPRNFGKTICDMPLQAFKKSRQVTPEYLFPPNITKPKKTLCFT